MTKISFPTTTTTLSGAQVEVENQPQKILIVSQMVAAGTAVSGELNENIQSDADTLAGSNSIGAALVRAVRGLNQDTQIDLILLDDAGAGTQAAGEVAFTGTATEAGELTVIIGSEQNHSLSVPVSVGDTATVIGDTLAAAIAADSNIQVTGANTTGTVAITAVHKGTVGNDVPLEVRGAVAGVTVALTAMSGGATDPTLTGVFDAVDGVRYQTIVWTWPGALTELSTLVNARFNVTDDILDGIGFTGKADTLANTLSALGAIDAFICYVADKAEDSSTLKGASNVEHPLVQAANAAALRALKLTEGAAIASINVGDSGLDGIGGPALASRPLANTPVRNMPAARPGRGWSRLEITQINAVGGSVIGTNRRGNATVLGEMLLAYSTDPSFGFVNYFDTSVGIREYYQNNLRSRFAQSRLTDGSPVAGRPSVNKRIFEAALVEMYDTLSGPDFALTRAGEANRLFFIQNMVVLLDTQTGTVTWSAKSPIVTQVRNINGSIQIAFATSEGSITI